MWVLADLIKPIELIPSDPHNFFNIVFLQTFMDIKILGQPKSPYHLTLIGLVIFAIIAVAVNAVTEKLTSKKVGKLFAAIVVTVIGSLLFQAYVRFDSFDFSVEGVRIIAALIGAIIVAVFYVLIRGQVSGGGK